MSELSDKQKRFTRDIAKLLAYMWEMGYECAFGEALRSNEQAEINSLGPEGRETVAALVQPVYADLAAKIRDNGKNNGIRLSIHQDKLAIDLNLFKDGVFMDKTEDHLVFGEYWEAMTPENRWGGRFRDGNHYSKEYQGRK